MSLALSGCHQASATNQLELLQSRTGLMQALHCPCFTDTSARLSERRQSGATASTTCRTSQAACRAKKSDRQQESGTDKRRWFDLQDLLGPIGLALQSGTKKGSKVSILLALSTVSRYARYVCSHT